ncbi:hypothetical protein [Rhodopirellula halodulae]|nr:hypothetical protein [Rhodopirellula sp. JC740]
MSDAFVRKVAASPPSKPNHLADVKAIQEKGATRTSLQLGLVHF